MASNSSNLSNPNTRLRVFREYLGESQRKFGSRFGKKQRTYANYEEEGASIPPEVREGSARLGLNLNWLDTGEGPMTLPVKEVQPGAKDSYPLPAPEGSKVAEPAPFDPQEAAEIAERLLEEMVFKRRPWRVDLKQELIGLVAENAIELRHLGYSGFALEKTLRERIRLWLQLASGSETSG